MCANLSRTDCCRRMHVLIVERRLMNRHVARSCAYENQRSNDIDIDLLKSSIKVRSIRLMVSTTRRSLFVFCLPNQIGFFNKEEQRQVEERKTYREHTHTHTHIHEQFLVCQRKT
jgi:hypothetical protein